MSQHSNNQTFDRSEHAHLMRLEQLERELALLRRELGDESHEAPLPQTDFQALIFEVNDSSFAVPISIVREIVRYVKLTSVSDVPEAVVGAINVRGEVLPVLDARRRLGQPSVLPTLRTPILLLATEKQSFGLVVDAVDVVCEIRAKEVTRPTGAMAQSACISGVATVGPRVVQMLDVERTLSVRQWQKIASVIAEDGGDDGANGAAAASSDATSPDQGPSTVANHHDESNGAKLATTAANTSKNTSRKKHERGKK